MTTSSSSSQIHTATTLDPYPPEPAARPAAGLAEAATPAAAGPPGPAAVAEALSFETIPIELLREHFTKWLIETLIQAHFPTEPKPKRAKAANRPPTRKREGPLTDAALPPQQPESPRFTPTAALIESTSAARMAPPADLAQVQSPVAASGLANSPVGVLTVSRIAAPASTDLSIEASASSARPQYVRMGDKSVWLTKPMLRARGWTESAIRDFLPGPEALKPNPRFAVSGAPMPVWRPATVAKAESDPKWRAWLERSLQRRQTTLAALADSPDQEFRTRLELADQAIKDSLVPPTLLESLGPAM
ncbi:hypothetical protein [Glycomyces artemisiae]|nr:hypothetical protein [Glycomyces artemisiae]